MTHQPEASAPRPRILLVGWDGADWNFLRPMCEKGVMPALAHLARNGVAGELASLPPYLSPMLWNSIATGKRPWRHGIHGFTEVDAENRVRPISSRSRRVPALWNILTSQGWRTHVVGWFASHPAEAINGVCVSEAFFQETPEGQDRREKSDEAGSRPSTAGSKPACPRPLSSRGMVFPAHLAEELAPLRITTEALDTNLLRLLIPDVTQELSAHDTRVVRLAGRLAELYSVHNVTASLMETEPWDFAAVYFHFLDWVLHDFASFVPPRQTGVAQGAFARYSGVVEGACRLQDLLLADLLKLAGPNTLVFLVSDHGFATGAQWRDAPNVPAGIAAHHRPMGIFAACGPGLRGGTILQGASLLDITPTILHACGLPTGDDMDGRVLSEIFAEPRALAPVSTWDGCQSGAEWIAPPPDPENDDELLQRFIQLGYVDANVVNAPEAAAMQRIHNGWHVGMDLLDAGRAHEALPYLEAAAWAQPELAHFTYWLARCQARLGLAKEAHETMRLLDDFGDAMPRVRQLKGMVALESGRPAEALDHFEYARAHGEDIQDLATWKAIALQQTGKWMEAFELLKSEVTRRPLPETWSAIARCYLWAGRPRGAIFASRHAIARHPRYLQAHLTLAQALVAANKTEEGWSALGEAGRLKPNSEPVRALAERLFPDRKQAPEFAPRSPAINGDVNARPDLETLRAGIALRQQAWAQQLAEKRKHQQPVFEVGKPEAPASSGKSFVIVSGLPRSGTSLLMQMLREGGLEPMADEHRPPDIHNPEGFFEWEAVRRLPSDPNLIEQAEGKAVKVISALVPYLPRRHAYQVLAIVRPPREIAHSQARMLGDLEQNIEPMVARLETHQTEWLEFLRKAPHVQVLELQFAEVVAQPASAARAIAAFLGPNRVPYAERMPAAVRPELYRNRQSIAP